ncbi:hypothetical protein GSI_10779 [Ganoderma sinense ZZ0214-1]|uniref:Uncharacterized protein n=1 Tax=Ganoderma sinense ZZ0214-1 TaxID=1077348 RepID=A0A2G8S1L5_9APHY|nr:hypothetical protein GSI_10779 [Ganoderma sinense ZZ0214-1]
MSADGEKDGGQDGALTNELLSRQALSSSPANVLKYPPHREMFYSCDRYNKTEIDGAVTDGRVQRILGRWTMLVTWETDVGGARVPCRTVYIVDFHSRSGGDRFNFAGISHFDYAWPSVGASFFGHCIGADDWGRGLPTYYTFTKAFDGPTPPEFYQVRMDSDGRTLIGVRDSDSHFSSPNKAWVIMKKDIAPEVMVYYPSREELIVDRTSALKHFMLSAVWHQVRRQCRPMLFANRQMKRMSRILYLTGKESISTLTIAEKMEHICLINTLVPADLHFLSYKSLEPTNTQLTRDLRRPTGVPSHIPLISPRVGFLLIEWLVPEHRRRVRFELPEARRPRDPSLPSETTRTTSFGTSILPERSLLFSGNDSVLNVAPVIPPKPEPESPMWQDRRWEHPTILREPEYIVIQPRTRTPSQWSTSVYSSDRSVPSAHGRARSSPRSPSQVSTSVQPQTEPSSSTRRSQTPSVLPSLSGGRPHHYGPPPVIPDPPPVLPPGAIYVPSFPFERGPSRIISSGLSSRSSSPSSNPPPLSDTPSPPVIPGRLEHGITILPPKFGTIEENSSPPREPSRESVKDRGDLHTVHAIQIVLGMFFVFFVACLTIVCVFVYYSGGSLTISLERKGREL